MASREQLRLSAAVLAAGFLRLAFPGSQGTGDPHHLVAQAEHHLGPLGHNHLAVVTHHLQRASAAAAAGDHTGAEMHYRDAALRTGSQLGRDHPLASSVRAMAAHHNAMARTQMGLRNHPGAGLPHDVQHALGRYDTGHRVPSGSLAAHINQHSAFGRRPV